MKLIFRPLMPPAALTLLKNAASVLPILISVAVAPVSYWPCAKLVEPVAAASMNAAARPAQRQFKAGIMISLDVVGVSPGLLLERLQRSLIFGGACGASVLSERVH
jgi:hypothetical protein